VVSALGSEQCYEYLPPRYPVPPGARLAT
jgi:hypothetical protein